MRWHACQRVPLPNPPAEIRHFTARARLLPRGEALTALIAGINFAITETSARDQGLPNGSVLTYRRREPRPGERQVALWELQEGNQR